MAQPFRSKTGIYQLRRKVPPELRRALGHEYKRSLKTRDPAEAKVRFAEEWSRSETAFALARAQAQGADTLSERDMHQLAARWLRSELRQLEAAGNFESRLVAGTTWVNEQGSSSQESTELLTLREALDEDPDWDISAKIDESIKRALAANGIPAPVDVQQASRLAAVFKEHWLKLSEIARQRMDGDWAVQPEVLSQEPLSIERPRADSGRSLKLLELFEAYAAEKKLNDGDTRGVRKTINAYRATVAQFIELRGDLSVSAISREHVRDYRAELARLPASGAGIRALSAKEQIKKAETGGAAQADAADDP